MIIRLTPHTTVVVASLLPGSHKENLCILQLAPYGYPTFEATPSALPR